MRTIGRGALIAGAAATLLLAGSVTARATDKAGADAVHCAGINECKGKGACAGADNACKSKNECKGKGWVETSAAECTKQGGTVVTPES